MKDAKVVAIDLGASSGRLILVHLSGRRITLKEIHRFPNGGVAVGERFYTDILYIFGEIIKGLRKLRNELAEIESFAIDSWGVDFGLLDRCGELVTNPYHYRDNQAQGIMADEREYYGESGLYLKTGVHNMWYNTIYQISGIMKRNPRIFQSADKLLMIADLLGYMLTGEMKLEYTGISTTQMFDLRKREFSQEILTRLGISRELFPDIQNTGEVKGYTTSEVSRLLGIQPGRKIKMIATAQHDSASAAYAVPSADGNYIFINSGTWSIIGMVMDQPIISDEAFDMELSNEGAAFGKIKLVKNIMGMWLVQELRKHWEKTGQDDSYEVVLSKSESAKPFAHMIDPDDEVFIAPSNMAEAIDMYCSKTGQTTINNQGGYCRTVIESLAFKYREAVNDIEQVTRKIVDVIYMLGGAVNDSAFCQYIANATGKEVLTGPAEATAVGNAMIQFRAGGMVDCDSNAATIVNNSFASKKYIPKDKEAWTCQYEKYQRMIKGEGLCI